MAWLICVGDFSSFSKVTTNEFAWELGKNHRAQSLKYLYCLRNYGNKRETLGLCTWRFKPCPNSSLSLLSFGMFLLISWEFYPAFHLLCGCKILSEYFSLLFLSTNPTFLYLLSLAHILNCHCTIPEEHLIAGYPQMEKHHNTTGSAFQPLWAF